MRLIDADKLVEFLKELADDEWSKKASPCSWSSAFETFIYDTEEQPTVDAVPREELLNILYGKTKSSDFYPNADEDGMVDVSDYPYTK